MNTDASFSSAMKSLVPQLRHDKNGKVVTRHVKMEESSGTSSSIPAPFPIVDATAETEKANDIEALVEWIDPEDGKHGLVTYYLDALDDDLLSGVIKLAQSDKCGELTASLLKKSMGEGSFRSGSCEGETKLIIGSVELLSDLHDAELSVKTKTDYFTYAMRGLFVGVESADVVDDHQIACLKAMMVSQKTEMIQRGYPNSLDYYRDINCIVDNMQSVEPVAPVLRELSWNGAPTNYDSINKVVTDVAVSGYEPDEIAAFIKDSGITELTRALEAMKTASRPLAAGYL